MDRGAVIYSPTWQMFDGVRTYFTFGRGYLSVHLKYLGFLRSSHDRVPYILGDTGPSSWFWYLPEREAYDVLHVAPSKNNT